jgi:hypothetical protein
MTTESKLAYTALGVLFACLTAACLLCGCTTTAGTTAKLPLDLGVTEAGITVGVTGPLTGNKYEAAVPVNLDNLPVKVTRPAPQVEK